MKNRMRLRKRYEQGLTLIEASMVLALSAVVVAGVMLYYQSASDNNRLQNAQGEFGSLQTIVQGVYAGRNGYDGLSTAIAYGNSAIPPNLLKAGTGTDLGKLVPVTPWGGAVQLGYSADGTAIVADGTAVPGGQKTYAIEFAGVPQGACDPLSTQVIGSSLQSVSIDTVLMHMDSDGGADPVTVGEQCAKATPATHDIIWTLR